MLHIERVMPMDGLLQKSEFCAKAGFCHCLNRSERVPTPGKQTGSHSCIRISGQTHLMHFCVSLFTVRLPAVIRVVVLQQESYRHNSAMTRFLCPLENHIFTCKDDEEPPVNILFWWDLARRAQGNENWDQSPEESLPSTRAWLMVYVSSRSTGLNNFWPLCSWTHCEQWQL